MSGSMGKSKSGSSNRSDQRVWGEQTPYLSDLYGSASDLYGNRSPLLDQANRQQSGYAQSPEMQTMLGGAQNALNFNLDPSNAGNNPYLQNAMQSAIRPLTQNYQENVLSGITDQAVQSGQSGSSRQGIAEGIAGRGYLDQVGDITSRMANSDYSAGMDRMGRAIDQAGNVMNLGMLPSSMMRDAGRQNWQDLDRYRQIIGAPTTLGSSRGRSNSDAWNVSASLF